MEHNSFSAGPFKTSRLDPSILRMEIDIEKIDIPFNQPVWCRVIKGNVCLDIFVFLKHHKNIFIFGQDALTKNRSELPYFYRTKWAQKFEGSFVTFNDPTLYLKRGIRGGWWQLPGAIELSHEFIVNLAKMLETKNKNICIYGASAGGVFSLAMAGLIQEATVIADIPQVDLLKSPFSQNEEILRDAGIEYFKTVFYWWDLQEPPENVTILMNMKDKNHIRTQIDVFLNSVLDMYYKNGKMIKNLNLRKYKNLDETRRAHSPLEEDQLIPLINTSLGK